MRMVAAIIGRLTAHVDWLGLRVGAPPPPSAQSAFISQMNRVLSHDDSTINIVVIITIIIRSGGRCPRDTTSRERDRYLGRRFPG